MARKRLTGEKVSWLHDIRRNPWSYLLVLPGLIYTLIFGYLTLPYIVIAFQRYNFSAGIFGSKFVGFENFKYFFASNRAWEITWNTIYLNILSITTGTIGAVLVALMLNEIRSKKFLKVSQSLLILPNFLSWIIVAYIFYALFNSSNGWINMIREMMGMRPISMYNSADQWPAVITIIRLWKGIGINSVIYTAAITGIDEGLYEAAKIDGANKRQQIIHITLPLLMPTVCIMTLLAVGKIFYGDFQMTYALVGDNGIVLRKTDVIDTYVYRALRQTGDMSMSMAVSLYQALVGFVMVYGGNWLVRRYFPDGALF